MRDRLMKYSWRSRHAIAIGLTGWLIWWSAVPGSALDRGCRLDSPGLRKKYPAFLQYFQPVDTLFFDLAGLTIGEISHFVYMDSACALFDRMSGSLLYIDLDGSNWRKITVEDSLPGYRLKVVGMARAPEGGFVAASDPYYYLCFDANGRLARVVESRGFRVSSKFAVGRGRIFLYHHPSPSELSVVELNLKTERLRSLFPLDDVGKNLRNLIFRNSVNGGFLYDGESRFFIANAYENRIYLYSLSGKLLNIYHSSYRGFRRVRRDAAGSTPAAIMQFWRRSREQPFDMVYSIGFLDAKTIVAAYAMGKKLYLELFDKNTGKVLNRDPIRVPFPLVHSAQNSIFLEGPPRDVESADGANPYLIRFVPRWINK